MPADTRREFRLEPDGWRAYGQAVESAEAEGLAWQAVSIAKLLPITGCRLDEVVSLRWAEVDFDNRCFRFDAKRVKSGPFRPIGRAPLALLQELERLAPVRAPGSAFVFPGTRGERDQAYLGFKRAWKRHNLDYSPHCLRHAFASAAEDDCGLHESTLSVLLGHSKRAGSNVTRGYIMKNDASLLAATDKVSSYIWQAMTGDGHQAEIVPFDAKA
jgi:integrase